MSTLVFVMPDGSEEISGGNLYNAELCAALESASGAIRMTIAEFVRQPLAEATYLVDTLNLEAAKEVLGRRAPGQYFVLLVHHLPSFEPGLPVSHESLALERAILGDFDGYVATGKFTQDWLSEQGYAERTILIEPAIVVSPSVSREFSEPAQAVMVCNLIPRKGVLEFLDALALGIQENTELCDVPFFLDIIGRSDLDAPYGKACADRIAENDMLRRHVRLLGAQPHASTLDRYARANLFLSASRMETFGISLQEARYHGLPILAVRGGNSEHHVCEGSTGDVYETPAALAEAFLELVEDHETHASYFREAQRSRPCTTKSWADAARRLLIAQQDWFPKS